MRLSGRVTRAPTARVCWRDCGSRGSIGKYGAIAGKRTSSSIRRNALIARIGSSKEQLDAAFSAVLKKHGVNVDQIRMSAADGMQDFTMSLKNLVNDELIDRAVALEVAPNVEALKMALKGIAVATPGIL